MFRFRSLSFGRPPRLGQTPRSSANRGVGKDPTFPSIGHHDLYRRGEAIPHEPTISHKKLAVHEFHTGVINPSERSPYTLITIRCCENGHPAPVFVTKDQLKALQDNKAYIVAWGKVWYSDIFGIEHWTKFCVMRGSASSSDKCSDYNDTDRNYDPPKPTK